MNLTKALLINNAARGSSESHTLYFAAGFTPLCLSLFVSAYLSGRIAGCRIEVSTGTYGDLAGNLQRTIQARPDMAAICIEWDDMDPRLGVRRLGRVTWKDIPDILAHARAEKDRLISLIQDVANVCNAAVSLPHLPIPPLSYSPQGIVDEFEAELGLLLAEMQVQLASSKGLRVVKLNSSNCSDLSAALHSGFPYTIDHASKLGEALALALVPGVPKKGIIVDLDNTLWRGTLGEDGVDGVHWDLDHRAQQHGLFQQFLHALAAEGTLVAIASKNSPDLVRDVFAQRGDLVLQAEDVFPMEIHWEAKSGSVARILQAWSISADSVVFIDDSPLELADVEMAHPGILCRRFPYENLGQFEQFLKDLRGMFAKERIGEEDALRTHSLRTRASLFRDVTNKPDTEMLLQGLRAELTVWIGKNASDERSLELINKTNQFNLNGVRISEPLWRKTLSLPGRFLLTCGYKDRFGELGKIAALMGTVEPGRIVVESWVMSCRAFARRIEFTCLQQLFQYFSATEVELKYRHTGRNGPIKEFLESLGSQELNDGDLLVSRAQFDAVVSILHHSIAMTAEELEIETFA